MLTTRTTKFNVSKFLAHARDCREQAVALLANETCVKDIRSAYRIVMDDAEYTDVAYVERERTSADLRSQLKVAAGQAMQFGATDKQIDLIVSLAVRHNDFNILSGGLLTKSDASNIIDSFNR